jgi:hypothetical protein
MALDRIQPRHLDRLVELVTLLGTMRRWNRWALAYRATAFMLRRSRWFRRVALAAILIAVGALAALALIAAVVADTL